MLQFITVSDASSEILHFNMSKNLQVVNLHPLLVLTLKAIPYQLNLTLWY